MQKTTLHNSTLALLPLSWQNIINTGTVGVKRARTNKTRSKKRVFAIYKKNVFTLVFDGKDVEVYKRKRIQRY